MPTEDPPEITGVEPSEGPPGTQVTISVQNFDTSVDTQVHLGQEQMPAVVPAELEATMVEITWTILEGAQTGRVAVWNTDLTPVLGVTNCISHA